MYKKFLFAFLLMLNHSLMFGVIEAASMPDEEHPFGQAIPHDHLHDHLHPHDHHEVSEHSSDDDDHHEHHHNYNLHLQLNFDLPCLVNLDLEKLSNDALTRYQVRHQSLTYAPPVPPPNY